MTQIQVIRGLNLGGFSGRRVESGSLSRLVGRLPGLIAYIDPDGSIGMSPPCVERVNGTASPSAPENIGGLLVQTPPGQNFGSKRVYSGTPSAARGVIFPRIASTATLSALIAMQPSGATFSSGPYDAGILHMLSPTEGAPTRRVRFLTSGGSQASIQTCDIYNNQVANNAPIGSSFAASRFNVMLAVFSSERGLQEIYSDADGFTTPVVSAAYTNPVVTQDGTLEYGGYNSGYGTAQCSFKGYLMRTAVTSTDLTLPANKGAALAVAQAMRAYYSGPTGTGT